jgi:hypothetical protein
MMDGLGAVPTVLRRVYALLGGRDINHNDADLLPCLNITVGVRNFCEGVFSIDDRSKLARLHAALQEADKPVDAPRQQNDNPLAPCDRRPHRKHDVLRPRSEIRCSKEPVGLQQLAAVKKLCFSDRIHHGIEGLPDTRELFRGVVNGMVRAEGFDKLEMSSRNDCRHIGAR